MQILNCIYLYPKEYPEKRKFHSCFLVDNYVYLFGGMYCNVELNIFTGVENTVWRLDLDNLKWEDLKIKMPMITHQKMKSRNQKPLVKTLMTQNLLLLEIIQKVYKIKIEEMRYIDLHLNYRRNYKRTKTIQNLISRILKKRENNR